MWTMNRNKAVIAVLLCAMLALCAGCGDAGHRDGELGESITDDSANADSQPGEDAGEEKVPVPDFDMTLLDGEAMSFGDCRGKKVLLNFWATWCGPCVGEMPAFQRLADEYPDDLVILAVNCSEKQDTVQKFAEKKGYTFPIILDTEGDIQAMFGGITTIPLTVFIDEEGYIVTVSKGASDADSMYEFYKEELGL